MCVKGSLTASLQAVFATGHSAVTRSSLEVAWKRASTIFPFVVHVSIHFASYQADFIETNVVRGNLWLSERNHAGCLFLQIKAELKLITTVDSRFWSKRFANLKCGIPARNLNISATYCAVGNNLPF